MARKSSTGKFIISAGEIGSYIVCPEAWRLKSVVRTKREAPVSIKTGSALHHEWARNYDEILYLSKHFKLMVLLVALCVLFYALSRS